MGEQIGDAEQRVALVLSDTDLHCLAIGEFDDTVQGHGNGGPLILLDAPVVVRLEERHVGVLEQRIGLEIEPWAVDVADAQSESVRDRPLSDGHDDQVLAAVVVVELVAGAVLLAHLELLVTVLLEDRYGIVHDLALGLVAEEPLVSLAELLGFGQEVVVGLPDALGLVQQLLLELLTLGLFFCHGPAMAFFIFDFDIPISEKGCGTEGSPPWEPHMCQMFRRALFRSTSRCPRRWYTDRHR